MNINFFYPQKTTGLTCSAFGLCLLALALMVGCSGNYGRVAWDAEVTKAFKNNQVQPDYKYYYYGDISRYYAIVGLDPKWELRSRIWQKLEPDTEKFNEATFWIWDNPYYYPHDPRGAHILDSSGNKVGVYYSSLIYVTIKFEPNNQVRVMPDTAFNWGPDDNGIRNIP